MLKEKYLNFYAKIGPKRFELSAKIGLKYLLLCTTEQLIRHNDHQLFHVSSIAQVSCFTWTWTSYQKRREEAAVLPSGFGSIDATIDLHKFMKQQRIFTMKSICRTWLTKYVCGPWTSFLPLIPSRFKANDYTCKTKALFEPQIRENSGANCVIITVDSSHYKFLLRSKSRLLLPLLPENNDDNGGFNALDSSYL